MPGIDKLVARFPGEIQTWPMTYAPPMLTLEQIIDNEQSIEAELGLLDLEVSSPFNGRPFRRVKYSVCRATNINEEKALRVYERLNADFYNGYNDSETATYGDEKGFVIQISTAVTAATEAAHLNEDKTRWRQKRQRQQVSTDPALYGTIYVETDVAKLHSSMRTGDARERWGYIDLICSAPEHRTLGIGARLMQLALLGCMRRGIQHVVLDAVKSAVHKYRDWGFVPWKGVAKKRMTLMYSQWIMDVWNRLAQLERFHSNPNHGPRSGEITDYDEFSESEQDYGYNSDEHVEAIHKRYNEQVTGRIGRHDDQEWRAFNSALDENKRERLSFYAWDDIRREYYDVKRLYDEREVEAPGMLQWYIGGRKKPRRGKNKARVVKRKPKPLPIKTKRRRG